MNHLAGLDRHKSVPKLRDKRAKVFQFGAVGSEHDHTELQHAQWLLVRQITICRDEDIERSFGQS